MTDDATKPEGEFFKREPPESDIFGLDPDHLARVAAYRVRLHATIRRCSENIPETNGWHPRECGEF